MQTNQDKLQEEDQEPLLQVLRPRIPPQALKAKSAVARIQKFGQAFAHPHPKGNQRKQKSYLKDATKVQELQQPTHLQ